jgi:hypothetical protein
MKTLSRIILGLALAAPVAVASAARADDKTSSSDNKQEVTMDQLPKPVKSTVQREGKGKSVESMTKSTDSNGTVAYEIKYLDGANKETTLDVASDGKVLGRNVHETGAGPSQPSQQSQPKSDMPSNDTKPDDTRQNP